MKNCTKLIALLSLALVGSIFGCKEKFARMLPVDGFKDSTTAISKTPKVLYIIVDGARGWSVRDAGATNIVSLTNNAIYSWSSVSDSLGTDGTGWADLLTGVRKDKHTVISNSFTGNSLTQYPSIVKRIKEVKPTARIASFSTSSAFSSNLSAGADVSPVLPTDADVSTAVVNELNNEAASVVIGQFSGVNTAGATFGYDNSFPQYKNAILQIDQYVGQMMAAIKLRKNYGKENWLVIITSNHGGPAVIPASQNDGTIFSYPITNTFTIIYNASYQPKLIDKPFTGNKFVGNFLRFYSSGGTIANGVTNPEATSISAQVTNNNNVYNFGDSVSFTLEFKMKRTNRGTALAPNYSYTWPLFLSKKTSKIQQSSVGWGISMEGGPLRFLVGKPGLNHVFVNTPNVTDGNWHSFAFVVLNRNFKRYMRAYMDGNYANAETEIPATFGTIDDPASPLRLGSRPQDLTNTLDAFFSDIRIWKAPLPDAVIKQFACDTRVTPNHPFYNYLIGYWPGDDGTGTIMKDLSPAGNDFVVGVGTGTTLQWTALSDVICPPSTTNLSVLVPRTVDMPRQILSWLAIAPPESWKLDGRAWLNP